MTNVFVDNKMVFTANFEDELRMQHVLTTYTIGSGAKFHEEKSHTFKFHKSPQQEKLKFKYLGFLLNEKGWDTSDLESSLLQKIRTEKTIPIDHGKSTTSQHLYL